MTSPPATLGKYRLLQRLGEGGMGEVYLAETRGPGGFRLEVALKVIRPELASSPRFVELFLREGSALASIKHRNIVQVFDLDVDQGRPYLAMEYLRGLNLRELMLRQGGPLPWAMVAYVGAEVARGVAAAHALRRPEAPQGLIHGDLSPSNVVICFDGAVKVLDFGLARPAGFEQSGAGLQGKVPYLSPEALAGVKVDHRVDIYAQGVVLHELLLGRLLFRGASDAETLGNILHRTPPSLSDAGVPQGLASAVEKAMKRDRGARFQRSEELADALDVARTELGGPFGAAELATFVSSEPNRTKPSELPSPHPVELPGNATQASVAPSATSLDRRVRALAWGALLAAAVAFSAWKLLLSPSPQQTTQEVSVTRPAPSPAPAANVQETPPKRTKRVRRKAEATPDSLPPGFLADPFEEEKRR